MAELAMPSAAARVAPTGAGALVAIGLAAPASRFSFRGPPEAAVACGTAFGCPLPQDVCRASFANYVAGYLRMAERGV